MRFWHIQDHAGSGVSLLEITGEDALGSTSGRALSQLIEEVAIRPHARDEKDGKRNIAVWVDTSAALALERLARRYAVTQRQILERLLRDEDQRTLDQIPYNSDEWNAYFGLSTLKAPTAGMDEAVTQ